MDGRQVLRDRERDAVLSSDGFVSTPLLTPEDISQLLATYGALVPQDESGVQLDFVREDRELVRRLTKDLHRVLDPRVEAAFADHEAVLISYIVKHPGPGSDFYLHRDITVNDGRTNRCVTLWIPLVDVDPSLQNGGLGVIPRSENLPTGDLGFDASVLVEPFRPFLLGLLEGLALQAGEALVYDARLLHASPPNLSSAPRPAIGVLLGRRTERLVHVVPTGRRHRLVYAIDRDFFVDHHPADIARLGMPTGYEVIDEYDDHAALSANDLRQTLGVEPPADALTTIPPDLVDGTDGRAASRPFPTGPSPIPPCQQDSGVDPTDLDPVGEALAGALVTAQAGSCVGRALVAKGRRVGSPPTALPVPQHLLRSRRTRELAMIAIGPGGRLAVRPRRQRGTRAELIVVDAPQVRAGVRTSTNASTLDLGRRLFLPDDEPVTMWNDGPGPAVVLLRRALGPHPASNQPRRTGRTLAPAQSP